MQQPYVIPTGMSVANEMERISQPALMWKDELPVKQGINNAL